MRKIVLSMLLMLTSFGGTLAHAGDSTSLFPLSSTLNKTSQAGGWDGSVRSTTFRFNQYGCYLLPSRVIFIASIRMNGNVFQSSLHLIQSRFHGAKSTGWVNGYAVLRLPGTWQTYNASNISFTSPTAGLMHLTYTGPCSRATGGSPSSQPLPWSMSGIQVP